MGKPLKRPEYARHLQLYAWAARFCFNKYVFELGCGEGFGLQLISAFAQCVTGIDNNDVFLKRALQKQIFCPGNMIKGDLNGEIKFPDLPADAIVIAFEVLEHIKDPKRIVEEVARSGTPIIFSVPHDYPHPLHLTDYKSWEDALALVPKDAYKSIALYHYQDGNVSRVTEPLPALTKGDRYVIRCH